MARRTSILELRSVRGTGGGPEKTILLGAEHRDRERFDVTVCYIRDLRDEVFGIDRRAGRMDVDYVEVRERHSFDWRIWKGLTAIVRSRGITIVHAHEYKTDLVAWFLANRTGILPLATVHGWTGHSRRERMVYYPIDKRLLSKFPRVIAVSTEIKDELVRTGMPPDRVIVVLNAIDPVMFRRTGHRAAARASLGLSSDAVVIGAVGRLEPQKRFDLLLDAMRPLLSSRPNVELLIAGDGSQRGLLEQQARELGVQARTHFVGHRQDIVGLHEALDVFVQSSDYEGTPNAVLEAMAMETPLVATDAGGTAELVRPDIDGLVVSPRDVAALRTAITSVLDNPINARSRARAARTRIETELSFDACTRRLESVYSDLAGSRA